MTPLIEAQNWGWRYAGRKRWAVRDLTLAIGAGERVLLLGPSGAGKSTLLLALAGVLGGADEGTETGRLLVDGQHPTRRVGQVGMVQQDPQSQVVLTQVGDDVAFGCENVGMPTNVIWPRVRAAVDAVDLAVELVHQTSQLSGGQTQRLVLAGALAMHAGDGARPRLLLLDEPTANLDPAGVAEVRAAVGRLVADRATGLVVVEHHVDVWCDLVDRVIVLSANGGVVADGTPAVVFGDYGDELAAQGVWVPGVPVPVGGLAHPEAAAVMRAPARPQNSPALSRKTSCEMSDSVDGSAALRGFDLTIGYDRDRPVLEHLDVAIPAGVSTVITGPNGVGKSTLALTLAGLLPQLSGRVAAADEADPHAWTSSQLLTRLGTVFQQPQHQFVTSSVRAELAVGLRALKWTPGAIDARVDELLVLLHLDELADANPFTLSGGEMRRLSVGTVLASEPAIIVLDEPTFGQDRATWCDMVALITQLVQQGRTVISVTHDQDFIDALGQHRIDLSPAAKPTSSQPERPDVTLLDQLNPVARLLFAFLLAVPVLITLDWVSASIMLGLEIVVFSAVGGLASVWRRLVPVLVIGLIAAMSMALYGRPGGQVFVHWWLIEISQRSLLMAVAVFLRILALALAAVVLVGRVDPTLMADGLAQLARLPARFVLGTLAGVRMLGLMIDDWRALGLARRARGLDDHHGVRRFASMAFVLLVMAIRRGARLATAMEVRGFNAQSAKHRTWARPSRLSRADLAGLVVTMGIVAASLLGSVWAGTFWLIWTGASS